MSLSPQTLRIRTRIGQWTQKERKHWDLFRHLTDPVLLFDSLKLVMSNAGSAGIDGLTIKEVRGREWEFACRISRELKERTYRPSAVRRVYIPKSKGGRRPLGIPTLCDRTVQKALCLLLEMIYEPKFHGFSYGFRPGKRATDCVAEVAKAVYTHRHVLEADIAKFFDQVSHKKLLMLLKKEIVDPRVLKLVGQFLKCGWQEMGKPWQPSQKGTPQGGPLSPLLANVYLHHFLDERFNEVYGKNPRVKLFRYADDFVMVSTTRGDIKSARRLLYVWMREAGLRLKEEKTREVDMSNRSRGHGSKFDFLGFKIHLRSYRDNPKRFWIARQPSEASRKALRQALRERLLAHYPFAVIKQKLQQTWIGWTNYFRYSNANRIFYREYESVKRLIWRYLRRRFRRTRNPVKWSRLQEFAGELIKSVRPVGVITGPVGEQQQTLLPLGRA